MSTDIFLSYASKDASKASELSRILESQGWSVWWDRELNPGEDFELEIDQALAASKVVIVLWSEQSITSDWVRNEAKDAKETHKLVPVILDNCRIPLSFRSLNTIDLQAWPDKKCLHELKQLQVALTKKLNNKQGKKPEIIQNRDDELTLSVRVAHRVAELSDSSDGTRRDMTSHTMQMQIERYITDICVDFLTMENEDIESRIKPYFLQLAGALNASEVINSVVNFSTMSVESINEISGKPIDSKSKTFVTTLTNDYCVADGSHGLLFPVASEHYANVLCIPLKKYQHLQTYSWFLSSRPNSYWSEDLQNRLLKITEILSKIERHDR